MKSLHSSLSSELSTQSDSPPWPLYQQVKHLIIRRINSGHWTPGSKIPSENELVESLGISRMTINRALKELTAEGVLIRKRGAGSFVAPEKPKFALFTIRSIAEEIESWGGKHHSKVLQLKSIQGTVELSEKMIISKKATVFYSLIVHFDGDLPIQMAERFVNPKIFPEFINQDFTKVTPSEYLLKVAPVDEIEHVIETQLPDKDMRKLLKIDKQEPCLVMHRNTWINGALATQNRFIYPGSRYSLGGRIKASNVSGQLTI